MSTLWASQDEDSRSGSQNSEDEETSDSDDFSDDQQQGPQGDATGTISTLDLIRQTESMIEQAKKPKPFVDSTRFAIFMCIVIIINIFLTGLETDIVEGDEGAGAKEVFDMLDRVFIVIYVVELMMRFATHRRRTLDDRFTILDIALLMLTLFEHILYNNGFLRVLPIVRTLRLAQVLRTARVVKHSRELLFISHLCRTMIRSLFWSLLLLFLLLLGLGTFVHIVIGQSAAWNGTMDPELELPLYEAFDTREYFGSVLRSVLSLLQVVTLDEWAPHIARPILKKYPAVFLFFLLFLFLTTYGLLVCVAATLIQDSMAASRDNQKALQAVQKENRRRIAGRADELLGEVDTDNDGEWSVEELKNALETTDLPDILRELGVPVMDAESLIRMLDKDGGGTVNQDELIEGAMCMDDHITPRDYQLMAFWLWNLLMRTRRLEHRLEVLAKDIRNIRHRLVSSFGALHHYIRTQGESELRRRALHHIRTMGPAMPPSLIRKANDGDKLAIMDQASEFMVFTKRIFGHGHSPAPARKKGRKQATAEVAPRGQAWGPEPPEGVQDVHPPALPESEDLRSVALVRGSAGSFLPPAPPRFEVQWLDAKESHRTKDKYGVTHGFKPNPHLRELRQNL